VWIIFTRRNDMDRFHQRLRFDALLQNLPLPIQS
jgi:hypothetical protein